MNTELANKVIDAIASALKTVDGARADGSKTTLFAGTIESENGVRTVKSINGDIVSEFDGDNFIDRIANIAKTVVIAVNATKEADEEDRKAREAAEKAEAEQKAREAKAKAEEAEAKAKKAAAEAQSLRTEAEKAEQQTTSTYRPPYRKVLVEDI